MVEVAEQFLFGNNDLNMPSCSGYLPLIDVVFTTGCSVGSRDDVLSRAGLNGVITVGIDLQKLRQSLQIVQRHVNAHHGHHVTVAVIDGTGTAHNIRPCSRIVQIRLAPPAAVMHKPVLIPLHLGVIVLGTAYLTRKDTILRDTAAAYFVEISFFGIIIGHESDCHARVLSQRTDGQPRRGISRIRILQMFLHQCS